MSQSVVAKRYADALFQLASEKGISEKLVSELSTVKEVFEQNESFISFLQHPQVALGQKKKLIDEAFQKCDKVVQNTLKLLIDRNRINEIVAIIDHFVDLFNEEKGVAIATVYSARQLSEDEKASLENTFKTKLNKQQIIITNEVDPSIIGGIKVRIGNTIYDGSISGKLNRMKSHLTTANF